MIGCQQRIGALLALLWTVLANWRVGAAAAAATTTTDQLKHCTGRVASQVADLITMRMVADVTVINSRSASKRELNEQDRASTRSNLDDFFSSRF